MCSLRFGAAVVIAAALAVPASAQAASYEETVLADNPLTYLRMQDATGGIVQDFSPNDRDGALAGAATLSALGPFTGAGNALALGQDAAVNATVAAQSGSVEMWVNPGRLRRGQQAGIAAHGDPAGDGWALGVGAKRKLAFMTGNTKIASKVSLPANTWSMLSVTWNATKVTFAVNGGSTSKQVSLTAPVPTSQDGGMVIGGNARGTFSGSFTGRLDEVALFAQQLTSADMQEHFAAAQLPVNTVPVVIDGNPVIGGTIGVIPGTWTGSSSGATYQWQRCDANGDDCDDIEGATQSTYLVTVADTCSRLRVVETRSNDQGTTSTVSEPSAQLPGPCPGASGAGTQIDTPVTGGGTGGTGASDGTGAGTDVGTGAGTDHRTDAGTGAGTDGGTGIHEPATGSKCLKLMSGRRTLKMRNLGKLRLRVASNGCISNSAPLRLSFRKVNGKKLISVKYRLDAKRLREVQRPTYEAPVKPAKLTAGKHRLTVRVTPHGQKARTAKLRLRVAMA